AGLVDPAGHPRLRVAVLRERGDRLPGGGGQGEPEVGEDRVHRLVERRAAAGAVTGAAGGDALRLGAGEVGAAGVAGLGAHRGPGQSVDPALRVADARVVLLDGAAVPSRGRAGTAHGRPDQGLHGAGDLDDLAVLCLDAGRGRPLVVGGHPGHVLAGEGGRLEGALRGPVEPGRRVSGVAAVPGGDEAGLFVRGDGEPDRAAGRVVDVEGVAAGDVRQQARPLLGDPDVHVLPGEPG